MRNPNGSTVPMKGKNVTTTSIDRYIMIEIQNVEIHPTGKRITSNSISKMWFILRYLTQEIVWMINCGEYEFIIPLRQVMKFRVQGAANNVMTMNLREGFMKYVKVKPHHFVIVVSLFGSLAYKGF